MIGETISHYTILEKLGEGGMGVVYKADDSKLKRTVALKFLSRQAVGDEHDRSRFIHEAQAAAALNHPNICTIHEIGEHEGNPFIVMEFIEGMSLRETIRSEQLSLDDAVHFATQAAEALVAAHDKGIVHRDIKSANIMISGNDTVTLMDFGLAKSPDGTQLTTEGTTVGTTAYLSPEQARGEPADHRSDIWSLGVVLYEMLTGQQPFQGEHEQAVIYSILNTDPQPLTAHRKGIPMALKTIVFRCLEKDPAKRYQSAKQLVAALSRALRLDTTQAWQVRVEKAKARSQRPRGFRPPMGWGLWILLVSVPAIAFLITQVLVPRYFSSEVPSTGAQPRKLAVLPFENLGPPSEEYFADGITEELIARLAKIDKLGVIARTSVMKYKQSEKAIREIGEELGVDYILEGTVRWQRRAASRDRVRITPQLVRVSDETHLWAEVYQRDMTDIFAIQSDIAAEVAEALNVTLLDGNKKQGNAAPTENPDAYHAYLEGRFWWNKRSQAGFDRAIQLFDKAIGIDPDYALAYAGKAECYCMLAVHLPRPGEYLEIARTAAQRAVELDGTLAQAHSALGWIAWTYDYNYKVAERSFKRAIELDPAYATAYNWYGVMLACIGRDDEAMRMATQAQKLDPGSLIVNRDLGCVLSWVGRYDEAERQLLKTIAMDSNFLPAHAHLGRIYAARGSYKKALTTFETIRSLDSDYFNLDTMLGYTYAKAGYREKAQHLLDEMTVNTESQPGLLIGIALVHEALGDRDAAFRWLERSVENREFGAILLGVHVWMGDLRSDPRFEVLLEKIGLKKDQK